MSEALLVRLSGHVIGELLPGGAFRWVTGWEGLAPMNSTVLSNSLPFGSQGLDAAPFFGGLLPEGIGLERLARETGVASHDLYGLLAEVGADVGGCVTIGEPNPPLDPIVIDETELERVLGRAAGYLRGSATGGGGSSAAGVQPKVALTRELTSGRWLIGRGSTPSTHLLKPVPRESSERIRAEALLNDVARELGLSAHDATVESAGERDVLIVERYDRVRRANGTIGRIHQEDAAQAIGLPWGGNDKYENVNARASLANIARVLQGRRSVFESGPSEADRLLELVVLNTVAGNTDAHAKNFSIMRPSLESAFAADATVRLADAYDLVPQSYFDSEPEPLAMRVNGESSVNALRAEDIVAEAQRWGLRVNDAERVVGVALDTIAGALSGRTSRHGSQTSLVDFLGERAENLARGDRAWTRSLPAAIVFHAGT